MYLYDNQVLKQVHLQIIWLMTFQNHTIVYILLNYLYPALFIYLLCLLFFLLLKHMLDI